MQERTFPSPSQTAKYVVSAFFLLVVDDVPRLPPRRGPPVDFFLGPRKLPRSKVTNLGSPSSSSLLRYAPSTAPSVVSIRSAEFAPNLMSCPSSSFRIRSVVAPMLLGGIS